jgi:hypothetical protein
VITWFMDHNIWLKSCSIEWYYLTIFPLCYGAKLLTILVYFFNCLIWTVKSNWRINSLEMRNLLQQFPCNIVAWVAASNIARERHWLLFVLHGAIKSLLSCNLLLHYNSKLLTTLMHFSISFIWELKLPVECWLLTGVTQYDHQQCTG